MMYPPLARVKYEAMGKIFGNKKLLAVSLVQNRNVGPAVMFGLAALFLRDKPELMMGLVLVGLALHRDGDRMDELTGGDRDLGVGLVAFNAVFQMLFYAVYIYLFIRVGFNVFGPAKGSDINISFLEAAKARLIYLGIPFCLGIVTRYTLLKSKAKTGTSLNSSRGSVFSPSYRSSSRSL